VAITPRVSRESDAVLEDGEYDGIVVDADADGDAVRLEVTILAGPHKGEVVSMLAAGLAIDPLDALGSPVTLVVTGGEPRVTFDQV
jgi:hypothetical protein